jgi:predicted Zn-dependent protease
LRADEPAPYQMLAMMQADQGQTADAEVTARMLRDRPKLQAQGWLLLGDVLARAERKPEALKAFAEAAKAGASEEGLLRRVKLLDSTGEQGLASTELNNWLSAHPKSVPVLFAAARRYSARNDYASAARTTEAIVKLAPNNYIALNELAWVHVLARNPAALATARKAADMAPDNAAVLDTLALAQIQADQKKEGAATLRRALALAPGAAILKIHLAELLVEDGKKKEAADLLRDVGDRGLDSDGARRLQSVKGRL